jgi:hypothetical protein
MRGTRNLWIAGFNLVIAGGLTALGCYHTPLDNSEYANGPAPLRMRSPANEAHSCCYEDSLTGGQVFDMYCSYCHNAPALGERPFANFKNVAAHMRVRANLTGKEYAKLLEFLQRWHDVPPGHPPIEPEPKRFIFSQPIAELRPQAPAQGAAAQPQTLPQQDMQRSTAEAAQSNNQPR